MFGRKAPRDGPASPRGRVPIGTMTVLRFVDIPGSAGRQKGLASASVRPRLYVTSDESGIMGLSQGPYYVMGATVVSNWDLYGGSAIRTESGEYAKFSGSFDEIVEESLWNVDSLLEGMYLIAIRKDGTVPAPKAQKAIHAAGIAALATQILKVEKAHRIEVAIDFSTLTKNMDIGRVYENNPYRSGYVHARVEHARDFGPLATNDFAVGAMARWMNWGLDFSLQYLNGTCHYTITDYNAMKEYGEALVLAIQQNLGVIPISDLDWKDIKISEERIPRENDGKPRNNSTRRSRG